MVIISPGNTHTHTHTHTHSIRLLWTRDRSSQRALPDKTQHTQKTAIHVPGGIRTRNPSKPAVAEYCCLCQRFSRATDMKNTFLVPTLYVHVSYDSLYTVIIFPIVDEGAPSACRQCSPRALFPVQRQDSWDSPTPVNLQWEHDVIQFLHSYSFSVCYSYMLFRFVLLTHRSSCMTSDCHRKERIQHFLLMCLLFRFPACTASGT
jgi:hypothetical protein